MAYTREEVIQHFPSMVYDYIDLLSEDYLRAVVRNEYCGQMNHMVKDMSVVGLIDVIGNHVEMTREKVYFNSQKTHSRTTEQIIDFFVNFDAEAADKLLAERFSD